MALALAPFGVLANSQFLRLCAQEHNRNYVLTLFMLPNIAEVGETA
jgi:hypothetical protein